MSFPYKYVSFYDIICPTLQHKKTQNRITYTLSYCLFNSRFPSPSFSVYVCATLCPSPNMDPAFSCESEDSSL